MQDVFGPGKLHKIKFLFQPAASPLELGSRTRAKLNDFLIASKLESTAKPEKAADIHNNTEKPNWNHRGKKRWGTLPFDTIPLIQSAKTNDHCMY